MWQVRRLRERLGELLRDPRVHRDYDEEFVGQVVADRLADLARTCCWTSRRRRRASAWRSSGRP
ncbi:MAG: hypothetical protein U0869_05095 [Chloroflexota bacterium]